MNFFQPIQDNPNATVETVEKKRIGYWAGLKVPKELIEARAAANKGRITSNETRAKISAKLKGRVGVPKTEEQRKKLSEANMGRIAPDGLLAYIAEKTKNSLRYEGLTVKEWAEVFHIGRSVIRYHLKRHGHLDYVGRTSGWAIQKETK